MSQPIIDWNQRRYEIAKEMLPTIMQTAAAILTRGYGLGSEAKGKTLAEYCAESACTYADALIAELNKATENLTPIYTDTKEVAIGQVIEFDGVKLICVELPEGKHECTGCAFYNSGDCKYKGPCSFTKRTDGKDVVFIHKT